MTAAVQPLLAHPRLGRIAGTSLFYALDRAVVMGSMIVLFAVVARMRPAAEFGLLTILVNNLQIALSFLYMGCEAVLIREFVRGAIPASRVTGVVGGILLAASLVAILGLVLLTALSTPEGSWGQSALLAIGLLAAPLFVAEAALKAQERAAPVFVIRAAVLTLGLAVKTGLIAAGFRIEWVLWIISLESIVVGLSLWLVAGQRPSRPRGQGAQRESASFLLRQCLPAMISSLLVILYARTGHLTLSVFGDLEEISLYGAAFLLITGINIVAAVLFTALLPDAVRLSETDPAQYRRLNARAFAIANAVGYCAILASLLLGGSLLELVFGEVYREGKTTLVWLSVFVLFSLNGTVRSQMILVANAQRYHAYNALLGFCALLPLTFVLVPVSGAVGAAAALGLATFLSSVLTSFAFAGTRDIGWLQLRSFFLLGLLNDRSRQ